MQRRARDVDDREGVHRVKEKAHHAGNVREDEALEKRDAASRLNGEEANVARGKDSATSAKGSFAVLALARVVAEGEDEQGGRLACASAGSSGASGLAESSRTISVARSAVSSRASSQARALVAAPAPSAPAPAETSREVWY